MKELKSARLSHRSPHVAFVPLTGARVCSPELRALGLTLPGLRKRSAAIAELPALGLLTLAGMLPENWTCSYHPASGETDDQILADVLDHRPTLVAISALTASIQDAWRIAGQFRAARVPVVMGGLHVNSCPNEAMEHCDAVVVGPGEATWPAVLADAESGRLQREYGPISRGLKRCWATPRFDLLPGMPARWTLQTQRGCPFACDFCAASRLLGPFQEKPLTRIADELASICRISPQPIIELADDNTFAGTRDAEALCAVLSNAGARWFTESDWRIGERPKLLVQIAAAGCVQVLVGIESLVFRYPGMGAKQAELDRIMAAVQAIQDAGICVNGCFILGSDSETRASIERLIQFVLESPFADVQLTLQTPFPGTGLRRRLEREGRLLTDRAWSHYTLFDVTYQPDCLSVAELERALRDALQAVYGPAATARRAALRREVWRRNPSLRKQRLDHVITTE